MLAKKGAGNSEYEDKRTVYGGIQADEYGDEWHIEHKPGAMFLRYGGACECKHEGWCVNVLHFDGSYIV